MLTNAQVIRALGNALMSPARIFVNAQTGIRKWAVNVRTLMNAPSETEDAATSVSTLTAASTASVHKASSSKSRTLLSF